MSQQPATANGRDTGGYAPVNGLEMYYEIHGSGAGVPLVLVHGAVGDLAGLPKSQLAILPGTTHITTVYRTDLLLAMIPPFLDAPDAAAGAAPDGAAGRGR